MLAERINIATASLLPNDGQLAGVPRNPRTINKAKFQSLINSLKDDPEMLEVRELIVFPFEDGKYIVLGGNMRLQGCKELGIANLPCKVLNKDIPVEKLRAIVQKDNIAYGEFDWEALANEWSDEELIHWGMDLPNWTEAQASLPPKPKSSLVKLELLFDDLDRYDHAKMRIAELIKDYPGTQIKEA